MAIGNYTLNNSQYATPIRFKSNTANSLATPIDSLQTSIEQGIDTIAEKINEKKDKKSTKTAIAVGSSVVVLSGLLMLLNPRYSPKIMAKLKSLQQDASLKLKTNKDNYLKSKFYQGYKATVEGIAKGFNAICNFNSGKDIAFQYLCCDTKKNIHLKNKTAEKALKWADNIFVKIFKNPHEQITKGFDCISKATVRGKYKKANKNLNKLEDAIQQLKSKLPAEERNFVELKLKEIQARRNFFTNAKLDERFAEQDYLMRNLERDYSKKLRNYRKGFGSKFIENKEHVRKGLNFWAEDILRPQKQKIQQEGKEAVENLISSDNSQKGLYNEICEIFEKHLSEDETILIKRRIKSAKTRLKKANISECHEYFDKKRDLKLGSAPTDVLSALGGLGLCGLAVGTAHNKDERISRLVTTGIPVVVGLGTSLVCTAMLFSAASGLLIGGATGLLANFVGNKIDKHILGNNDEVEKNPKKEVENA